MRQPEKWWMGLIPVAALWLAADFVKTGAIEADIGSRASAAVTQASPDIASAMTIAVAGRDVRIEGPEFTARANDPLGRAVADAGGVRLVDARFTPVTAAKPYVFSTARVGDRITLSGFAPLPAARDRLLDAVRSGAPGLEIIDKLAFATGAPEGFESIASRGASEAAKLDLGAFTLTYKAYSIEGTAATSAIFEAAVAATQQLPAGATLARADIRPPEAKPFAWSATTDGVAATIIGSAPSIEARAAIARAAATSLPGKMIVDQMQVASGAPAGDFAGSATYALAQLGRLAKGRVVMSDGAYSISGEAATPQAYEAALAGAKQLPAGLSLARADILAPEVKPYIWSAATDGSKIVLSGMAPSAGVREAIVQAATRQFQGRQVVNQMGIARGAPDGDFMAGASHAIAELAHMSSATATISDGAYSLFGDAATPRDYDAAIEGVKQLPQGLTLARAEIQTAEVRPFVWKAASNGATLTLSGYAPSAAAREAIAQAAAKAFAGKAIVNDLEIARGV